MILCSSAAVRDKARGDMSKHSARSIAYIHFFPRPEIENEKRRRAGDLVGRSQELPVRRNSARCSNKTVPPALVLSLLLAVQSGCVSDRAIVSSTLLRVRVGPIICSSPFSSSSFTLFHHAMVESGRGCIGLMPEFEVLRSSGSFLSTFRQLVCGRNEWKEMKQMHCHCLQYAVSVCDTASRCLLCSREW